MTEVLLVLAEPVLHDDLARCGAAAGYGLVRARADDCRREWLRAAAVVADERAMVDLLRSGVPRRDGVFAVGLGGMPGASMREGDLSGQSGADEHGTEIATESLWRLGLELGAEGGYLLPDQESALVSALSRVRAPARSPAGVVALVGGHGGAGTSTLAAGTALVAAGRGEHVLLLDLDPVGAGLDLLLGAEDRPGLRWQDIAGDTGVIAGSALRAALPTAAPGLCVLAGAAGAASSPTPQTLLAVLDAGRGHGDFVVADLGRIGVPGATGVLDSAEAVVVVTSATVSGVAATRRTVARIAGRGDPVLVVRGPSPSGLRPRQIAEAVGIPLLAALRPQPLLARRAERVGLRAGGRSPLGRVAGQVHAAARTGRSR